MPGTIVFKIIDFEFVFGKLLNFEKFARFDLLGAKQTIHLVRMVGFLFKVTVINLKQCSGSVF